MKELRRKILLPVFRLSELAEQSDPLAIKRSIKQGIARPALTYHYRYTPAKEEGGRNYNLFPVVLDSKSVPWPLGTLFILAQLEGISRPVMATSHLRADDLGSFKEWLDSHDNSEELLFNFPQQKLRRTTYRYRGFLLSQIKAREIAPSTAKRRMGAVISFYRWLVAHNFFNPEYPTWEENKFQLTLTTRNGEQLSKTAMSTDLSIATPKAGDDFDGTIADSGKLRPLTAKEQDWLIEAAEKKGNSECLLLQLFMLGTGARIESACTLRTRHFLNPNPAYSKSFIGDGEVYRLKAGPGTGIETKNNKRGTFQIPRPLYELLHVYALSARANRRQKKHVAKYGEHQDIYLFLTQQGSPYYEAKEDSQFFAADLNRRYVKNGQPIRQFITDHAIPYVREHHDRHFFYRPHDLRASYGMNMVEMLMKQVGTGQISLHKARLIVKDLMWHTSAATTDKYLDYKKNIDVFYDAINGYGERLQIWTERALKGLG